MIKHLFLSIVFKLLFFTSFCQTNSLTSKECRISAGIGIAGATKNTKALGAYSWMQLDYLALDHFSVAMEFDNFIYKRNGYYSDLPTYYPNEIKVYNHNFSLLIKYHVVSKGKLKIAIASGWTFSIRHDSYYVPNNNGSYQNYSPNITSFSDYRIPLLTEAHYPVSKKINVVTRLKYNLNPQNGDNYAAAIGCSLKL